MAPPTPLALRLVTVLDRIFQFFGTSRLGQVMASVAVMMAFTFALWLDERGPRDNGLYFVLYGGAMGLVAGLVLTAFKRGRGPTDTGAAEHTGSAASLASASCCTDVLSGKFDSTVAIADRDRYRLSGPDATTRLLCETLIDVARSGAVLDIGAGIGALGHELLKAKVATSVTAVEASSAYVAAGVQEAEARGVAADVRYVTGDFVDVADALPPADVVTLDRVVCCYDDYERLLTQAAGHARSVLALSYPKDTWYFRLAYWVRNRFRAWRGQSFQFHAHRAADIARVLQRAGWRRVKRVGTLVWWVEAYVRDVT